MITIILISIILFLGLIFVAAIPFALYKQATTKKSPCPKCENMVKLIGSPVKCPMCKTKLFKHGDGTYKIKD